jgi:MscS family membrane protein
MQLHKYFESLLGAYGDFAYLFQGFVIFSVVLIMHLVFKKLIARLKVRLANTHNIWDDSIVHAFSKPFLWFLWLVAFSLTARFALIDTDQAQYQTYVFLARKLGLILAIFWFVWRLISKIERKMLVPYSWRKPTDPTTVAIVGRLMRLVFTIAAALFVLQLFGVSPTGLLAFGGGGAIIVGIAAQDILANFFGGMMIFMDKPFKVGDWISSPQQNIEGTVQHIGWRTTSVLSFEKRPMYIPNSVFSKIAIVNPQRMTNRRIKTDIGVRYDDAAQIEAIISDMREMLKNHDGIDQKVALMVHFLSFGASSLNINIYCFTKTTVWSIYRDIQQDVFVKLLAIVEKHGAQAAFPTQTLHVPNGIIHKGDSDGRP